MSDLRLAWGLDAADLVLEANDLAREDGLETAVILSLMTDRRALEGDALPDGSTDRRGWWGDAVAEIEGDRIGSRLWLLSREKEQQQVLDRAESYAREALQWLLDDRIAERVEVTATVARPGVLALTVVVVRPALAPAEYRFTYAWAAQAARGV